ncbi:MAG: sulfite exporter TauE/SafE family protein [Chromatiales bacterium]|jgi:hypothetical protein
MPEFILPPGLTWPLVLVAAAAFAAGGLIKGLAGFGLPLIAISLLSTVIPIEIALGLNVVPPLLLNIWQSGGRREVTRTWLQFWPVLVSLPVGVAIGAGTVAQADPRWLVGAVGAVTVFFCVSHIAGLRLHFASAHVKPAGFMVGGTAGFLGAFTSVAGPPLIMYLVAAKTDPETFKTSLGLFFVLVGLLLIAAFFSVGFLTPGLAVLAALMTLPAGAGMWLGRRLARGLHPDAFRTAALIVLCVLGLNLLRRAVFP